MLLVSFGLGEFGERRGQCANMCLGEYLKELEAEGSLVGIE